MTSQTTGTALKPAEYHVLMALASGPMHGYALAQRMEAESDGRVRMMPGNLYAVLRRLLARKLVQETPPPDDGSKQDSRRRFFALTEHGQLRLSEESRQMARVAELALRRLVEAGDGDAS